MEKIQTHFKKVVTVLLLIIGILIVLFLNSSNRNRELTKEKASLLDEIDELQFTIWQYESNLNEMGYSFGSPDDLESIHQELRDYQEEIERLNEQIDDFLFNSAF